MRASRAAAQHRNPAPYFDGQSIPAGDALQGPRARKLQYGGCDIANMRKTLLDAARRNVWTRNESGGSDAAFRSEEHTSELQSLMRTSYAVFCLKKKSNQRHTKHNTYH